MVYCICRRPDNGDFMICCDVCNEWFHGTCVGVAKRNAIEIKKYSCPKCRPKQPIMYVKQRQDDDYSSEEEEESEEDNFPIKRKISNTEETQEPVRKQLKQEQPLRNSQDVSYILHMHYFLFPLELLNLIK